MFTYLTKLTPLQSIIWLQSALSVTHSFSQPKCGRCSVSYLKLENENKIKIWRNYCLCHALEVFPKTIEYKYPFFFVTKVAILSSQISLGVKGKEVGDWDEIYDLAEQSLIRKDCQALVGRTLFALFTELSSFLLCFMYSRCISFDLSGTDLSVAWLTYNKLMT